MNIPITKKGNVVDELHGQRIPDPYRWQENVESQAKWAGLDF